MESSTFFWRGGGWGRMRGIEWVIASDWVAYDRLASLFQFASCYKNYSYSSTTQAHLWVNMSDLNVKLLWEHAMKTLAHCFIMGKRYVIIFSSGSASQMIKVYNLDGGNLSTIRYHDGFMGQRIGPISCLEFHPHRVSENWIFSVEGCVTDLSDDCA